MAGVRIHFLINDDLPIKLSVKKGKHQQCSWAVLVKESDVHYAHFLRELLPPLSMRLAWQILDVFKGRGDVSLNLPLTPFWASSQSGSAGRGGCLRINGDDAFLFVATGSTRTINVVDRSTGAARIGAEGPLHCGLDADVLDLDRVVAFYRWLWMAKSGQGLQTELPPAL